VLTTIVLGPSVFPPDWPHYLLDVQGSAVQCSAVQCSAVQCSAVQCSAVQCSAVQCSAVQCSPVQCSAVQCSAVQCSAVQCSPVLVERVSRFCGQISPGLSRSPLDIRIEAGSRVGHHMVHHSRVGHHMVQPFVQYTALYSIQEFTHPNRGRPHCTVHYAKRQYFRVRNIPIWTWIFSSSWIRTIFHSPLSTFDQTKVIPFLSIRRREKILAPLGQAFKGF
jgi:hypothetical protein